MEGIDKLKVEIQKTLDEMHVLFDSMMQENFGLVGNMAILGITQKVERQIVTIAKRNNIEKVLVFGSRARGDYKRVSDIDLAITGGDSAAFSLEVNEDTSTLLEFDIVKLDGSVQAELLESIRKEGKVVYEKI